jgi:hypothetical protein
MSALSLGLVDHDPLVLYALQDLVQRSAEKIRLLWSVRSHRAALRRLASVRPAPDAILLSDDVADEAVLLVRAASEVGAAVVMMSASGGVDRQAQRFAGGVHGSRAGRVVVPKEDLLGGEAIWRVLQCAVTPVASSGSQAGGAQATGTAPLMARSLSALLSDKERRAIELYSQGLTTHSVAHRMSVAETTVKTYARRVYKKLGVGSRAEAVAVLAHRGVI